MSKYVVRRHDWDGNPEHISIERAVQEALLEKGRRGMWGGGRKGIEDQVESVANVLARLLDFMINKDMISEIDLHDITGYGYSINGSIVDNPNPEN